jgi:transposase
VWGRAFEALQDPDLEWMIIGRHRGPGAPARRRGRKKGVDDGQALGRSVGGFGTKVPTLVDALGNPVEIVLTAGQEAGVTQAGPLIDRHKAGAFILDKAYDSDAVVAAAGRRGAEAVTPPKKNRKVPHDYDKHLYKERKKVEWFVSLIEQYRRAATRYEKAARTFLGFVHLASIMVLLR